MPKDYVLFIHGVNTRIKEYPNNLITLINQTTPIEPLVVYWGDTSKKEEDTLRAGYETADTWNNLWFKGLRGQVLLQFAGDAALYLSRSIGADVVALVAQQVAKIKDSTAEDRLHLVAHSLGSVILFDLLFSSRWDTNDNVLAIRDAIYGVTGKDPNPKRGIRLGSITTMGSPIGIFSLMNVNTPNTHGITPNLEKLLTYLHQALGGQNLPWSNFVHPGDPIASPLEMILPSMVDANKMYIDISDILIPLARAFKDSLPEVLLDRVGWLLSKTPVSILDGSKAHGSYWRSPRVGKGIAQLIQQARGG
jgi:hypothetical protein